MTKLADPSENLDQVKPLLQGNFLFRELNEAGLANFLSQVQDAESLSIEKFYSNRPIYTAFRQDEPLEYLYLVADGGPVVMRSTPLDRVIAIAYPGGCFGMHNLPIGYGRVSLAFPSLVEAHKTTDVIKLPIALVQELYNRDEDFQQRYDLLFELREKFQYHLLNCSTYPPQAVASLLRALIYQERTLGNQPQSDDIYLFDLPTDLIARACQLNHRTVEQVLKGMIKVGLLQVNPASDSHGDWIRVTNPEGLKSVYGATRDKVDWWPLK
ncbi:MAG: Crp/Fnr family transcriptional regulator [Microcoleaceae cyanobacterium]